MGMQHLVPMDETGSKCKMDGLPAHPLRISASSEAESELQLCDSSSKGA